MLVSTPLFFFNDTATTEIYTLSLHDALPILARVRELHPRAEEALRDFALSDAQLVAARGYGFASWPKLKQHLEAVGRDRKSTRLNSSHLVISYAVFCLKKKNNLRQATAVCDS